MFLYIFKIGEYIIRQKNRRHSTVILYSGLVIPPVTSVLSLCTG